MYSIEKKILFDIKTPTSTSTHFMLLTPLY